MARRRCIFAAEKRRNSREAILQTISELWRHSKKNRHRQTTKLRSRSPRADPGFHSQQRAIRQQSGRAFPSTHPCPGTRYASVQIDQAGAAISRKPCRRLQSVQSTQAFSVPEILQVVSASIFRDLGRGDRNLVEVLGTYFIRAGRLTCQHRPDPSALHRGRSGASFEWQGGRRRHAPIFR